METTRTIKKLLQLLHGSIEKNGMLSGGMCGHIYYMQEIITIQEEEIIRNYIDDNRPRPGDEFYDPDYNAWFFQPYDPEIRLKWLKHHIEKL